VTDALLDRLRDIVQEDVGNRGLRTDPERNLISETLGDFAAACRSLARHASAGLAVVTGFYIPTADPPAAETDGPLGGVFLARALVPLGIRVAIAADANCESALRAGLSASGLQDAITVATLPAPDPAVRPVTYYDTFIRAVEGLGLTHLLAIERVGPSHGWYSIQDSRQEYMAEVPFPHWERCHTMRGIDITDRMSPAHWLFDELAGKLTTIGIGDGGNEIGMGKLPWSVIRRNIPRGGLVACRVPTDHLIVAGVSNWGAYALAAGVYLLRGVTPPPELFDPDDERHILEEMVAAGPLVDGVLGKPSATVDGLSWEQYSAVLPRLRQTMEDSR
jgi:hypothetical protein